MNYSSKLKLRCIFIINIYRFYETNKSSEIKNTFIALKLRFNIKNYLIFLRSSSPTININDNHNPNMILKNPILANGNKDIQLRDNTYNFIQKISEFVHSLSKNNSQQIDSELKTIVYSWNSLCDIYDNYSLSNNSSTSDNNQIVELDYKLTLMIDELKQGNLDKVISLSLELAHSTKKLFCFIVSNSSSAPATTLSNNNSLTIAINNN